MAVTMVPTVSQTLRVLRIVHVALLVSVALYVHVAIITAPHPTTVPPALIVGIALMAILVAAAAFVFRAKFVSPAEEILATNSEDRAALARWRLGQFVSLALAESVVVYGFVLKFLGAEWKIAGIFFAAGTALMLIFTPQRP